MIVADVSSTMSSRVQDGGASSSCVAGRRVRGPGPTPQTSGQKGSCCIFSFVIQHILPSNDDGELVSIHRQEFQPAVILNVTSQAGLWDSHIHIGLIASLLMTM